MKDILRNVIILIIVLVLSFRFSEAGGKIYDGLFGVDSFFSFNPIPLIGLPLIYIFSVALLFTAFGGAKKYWWIGILLIPAAIFEIYFYFKHIYFPILLGIGGWTLGYVALKSSKFFANLWFNSRSNR